MTPTRRTGIGLALATALISGFSVFLNSYGLKAFGNPTAYTTGKNVVAAIVLAAVVSIAIRAGSGVRLTRPAGPGQWWALATIGDHQLPILGRVSMDLVMFDVTDVPPELARRGGWVELIGPRFTVDDAAALAGTIGYEILTSLGRRYYRIYTRATNETPQAGAPG